MCTVSMITDHYGDDLGKRYPWVSSPPLPHWPSVTRVELPGPTKAEFDALKREVESIKELLKKAQQYDEATGQPNCEKDEKVALLKRIAEVVGVDLADVLGG